MTIGDPDLPILDELEVEYRALVAAELRHGEGRARLPSPAVAGGRRERQARRIARRATIVLVLLCLVGGVAFAAHFSSGGGARKADTAPAPLGRGMAEGWRLSGYRHEGWLCLLFSTKGDMTSECGTVAGDGEILVTSFPGPGHRFVIGLAGPEVSKVGITVGEMRVLAATHPVVDHESAVQAGVPKGERWFVARFDDSSDAVATPLPARIVPLDNTRRALGRATFDCSLGVVGPACARAAQARARAALR